MSYARKGCPRLAYLSEIGLTVALCATSCRSSSIKHVCCKWTSFENFLDPPCVVLAFLVLLGGPSFSSTPHTPTKQRRSPTITSMLETTLSSIESNIIDCSFSRFQSLLPGSAISWSCNYPTTELHPPALSATIRRTICIQH